MYRPTVFGAKTTSAAAAAPQLTLKPLRPCQLERLVLSVGAGDPATVGTSDLLPAQSVSEVTINGVNFIGTAVPATLFSALSTVKQPWNGVWVDPSTNITVTVTNGCSVLATAAALSAAFQGIGPIV